MLPVVLSVTFSPPLLVLMSTDLSKPASSSEEVGTWTDNCFVNTVHVIAAEDGEV